MNKISLKMRLGLGFGALLLIIAMMGIMSYTSINKLSDLSDDVANQMHKTLLATQIDGGLELQTSSTRGYVLSGNEASLKRHEQGLAQYDKSVGELSQLLRTEKGKAALAQADTAAKELRDIQGRAIELRRSGKTKEATDMLFTEHAIQVRADAEKSIDGLIGLIYKLQDAAQKEHEQVQASTVRLVVILAMVGMLIGVGVAVMIVRSITGAISRMLGVIQEIANKNLTIEDMKITSEDEIGKAGIALNEMKNSLHEVIQTMRSTAEQVAAASEELSATSQQITANSEETTAQAKVVSEAGGQVNTNLQTLASGAEEMNATIGEIAKNATEAAKVSGEAVEAAESANQTVSRLGNSSVEIAKVIEVITSIAQQTNLLALNATIEAARAARRGRGLRWWRTRSRNWPSRRRKLRKRSSRRSASSGRTRTERWRRSAGSRE